MSDETVVRLTDTLADLGVLADFALEHGYPDEAALELRVRIMGLLAELALLRHERRAIGVTINPGPPPWPPPWP